MFELSPEESKKAKEWMASKPIQYTGAIGGRFSYKFTPTGIGTIITIIYNVDHTELDVTEYDGF